MRTVIAGSRGIHGVRALLLIEDAVKAVHWKPTVVLSGTARGADRAGEDWARRHGIPVERWPADWNRYGKRAGFIRNEDMAESADALLALWDGESRGTRHMIDAARKRGLFVHVVMYRTVAVP